MGQAVNALMRWSLDILNSAQAGVVVIDPIDMSIIEINTAALTLLGLDHNDVVGKSCKDGLLCTQWLDSYKDIHVDECVCPVLFDDKGGIETIIKRKDGVSLKILRSITSLTCEDKTYLVESLVDVTNIREEEERTKSLLSIMHKEFKSEKDLARFALNEAVKLTRSEVGYLHFVRNGGPIEDIKLELFVWSDKIEKSCTLSMNKQYPINEAGILADCIRLKKPIIHNDYQVISNRKEYPVGSYPIHRHLSVPIFDSGEMVAVIGVGNKIEPYTNRDISQLCLFVSSMWGIMKRHRVEIKAQTYLDLAPAIFLALDVNGNITLLNDYGCRLLSCSESECLGINWVDNFVSEKDKEYVKFVFDSLLKGDLGFSDFENSIITLDGQKKIIAWKNTPLLNSNNDIIGVLSAGDDITSQRIAEQELEYYWSQQERVLTEKLNSISLLNNTHLG